jgi:hypothetical protein
MQQKTCVQNYLPSKVLALTISVTACFPSRTWLSTGGHGLFKRVVFFLLYVLFRGLNDKRLARKRCARMQFVKVLENAIFSFHPK